MITVEFPPGGADPVHRHNAHGFIYVLEGTVVMQVRGDKQVTLTPGQTFYEAPTMFMSLAATPATPSRRSFWCSWSRTRALRCWCQRSDCGSGPRNARITQLRSRPRRSLVRIAGRQNRKANHEKRNNSYEHGKVNDEDRGHWRQWADRKKAREQPSPARP